MSGTNTTLGRWTVVGSAILLLAGSSVRVEAQSTPSALPSASQAMSVTKSMGDSAAKAVTSATHAGAAKMGAMSDQVSQQLKTLADSLNLTPDQRAKAKPILMDQATGLKQIRSKYASLAKTPENVAAMKAEVLKLRDATDTKLGTVLSAPQMTAYKAKRDQWVKSAATKMGMGAMAH